MTQTATRRVWTRDQIKACLGNPVVVERALLNLHRLQTDSERYAQATLEHNGVGFNGVDAPFLSSLAEWIKASRKRQGTRLTPAQLARAQRALVKYSGQLARIANGEL